MCSLWRCWQADCVWPGAELRPLRVAIYSVYAVVLAAWLVRDTTAPRGATCRVEWLFRAVALFSGALLPAATVAPPALRSRATRARQAFLYVAAAALTVAALRAIGTNINPERALLAGRIAAFGLAGAAIYAIVWIEGAWPAGDTVAALATQGVVLGFFVEVLFGAELANYGGVCSCSPASRSARRASPIQLAPGVVRPLFCSWPGPVTLQETMRSGEKKKRSSADCADDADSYPERPAPAAKRPAV
jgi:hypothetical protein